MLPKLLAGAITFILFNISASSPGPKPKYLITFGDSYSQTWFDIDGEKPSKTNPIGNPPFPGWTASGGINWVGSLTSEYNNSITLTYNFAYGGATVDADIIPPYADTVIGLDGQVNIFLDFVKQIPKEVPWVNSNALVGVWIGVNDVGMSYGQANATVVLKRAVARYFELLKTVYDTGLRKIFLLTVPPTNLTPLMLQQDSLSNDLLVTAIELFNKELAAGFRAFKTNNPGVVGQIIDTSLPFNKAIGDPEAYGAPNAICYNEDGLSCLWFNDYHPGIAINKLVAHDVAEAVNGRKFAWH